MEKQNILVTGTPRSGTTVLGRMIAFSADVNYVWEPFNLKYRIGVPDYYPYIGNETNKEKKDIYDKLIENTIHLRNLKPIVTINSDDSIVKKLVKKYGFNRTTFWWYKWPQIKKLLFNPPVLLLKDPIGIFLTEYLIKKYNFKIIVTIRHPAAVAISRKKLEWKFNFNWWKDQEDLYIGHFQEIDKDLKKYENDFIDETSFHWLTCYSYIQKIKEMYSDNIKIIRHEDLCNNPVYELKKIYNYIGLKYDTEIVNKIRGITSGHKIDKSTMNLAKLEMRDAKNMIFKWKSEMLQNELDIIREITKPVSSIYYNDKIYWLLS